MEKPGTRSAAVQSAMEMHSARPTGSHEHDRSGWLDRSWSCQACSIMAFHKKKNGSPPCSLSPPLCGGMWVVSYWTSRDLAFVPAVFRDACSGRRSCSSWIRETSNIPWYSTSVFNLGRWRPMSQSSILNLKNWFSGDNECMQCLPELYFPENVFFFLNKWRYSILFLQHW